MQQPETTGSTRLYEILAWLEFNRKRVIAGFVALVLILVVGYIYSWNRDRVELAASDELIVLDFAALPQTEDAPPAANIAGLLKVAGDYAGTDAAGRAILMAGSGLYGEGKYPEAQAQFERFGSQYGSDPMAEVAALGVAACLDAQSNYEAALAAYQAVSEKYPDSASANRARLATAGIHEARNQPEAALKILDDLGKPTAFGGVAMEAMMRKQKLLQKHPALVKTNAPAPAAARIITITNRVATNLDLSPPAGAPVAQ